MPDDVRQLPVSRPIHSETSIGSRPSPVKGLHISSSVSLSMHHLLITQLLIAADEKRQTSPEALWIFMAVGAVLFFLMVIRPAGRDRKKAEDMLANLKKNDRVLTTGGIIGSVVMVSQDGKEITLKVDDNTRIKFHRNFITSVLVDEKKDAEGK